MFGCIPGGKMPSKRLGPVTLFLNAYMNAPVISFWRSQAQVAPRVK